MKGSEKTLKGEVQSLDKDAVRERFEKIYDKTYDYIYRYVMSKADTRETAEDIIQNVYLTFYRKMLDGDTVLNVKHYLLRMAKNSIADHYRTRVVFDSIDEYDDIPDDTALAELENSEGAAYADIMSGLEKTDMTAFRIFMLHFGQGMTLKETASALGIAESAVKTKMYRTLKKLKEKVKEDDGYALFRRG